MPDFRKIPVVIEARQLETGDLDTLNSICLWVNTNKGPGELHAWHNGVSLFIQTLEGTMEAAVFDYIIKGIQAEFYPCKPDIFVSTYEAV